MTVDFRSDNVHGAPPEIVEAVARANRGTMTSYGGDDITIRVRDRCREIFETDLDVLPVVSGTAANALGISALTAATGSVFCHEDAHIHRDELGAAEMFSGGARLVTIAGENGKLHPVELGRAIDARSPLVARSSVSLTEATEAGTVYSAGELGALCEIAHGNDCRVQLDGARFANALVSLDAKPADITWRAGVDIMTFGATKNGTLGAELIILFDSSLAAEIRPRWHRSGHMVSKSRFLSAQIEAYLEDDLWLRNARHANTLARRLGAGSKEVLRPVEANLVFVRFAPPLAQALSDQGFLFFDWPIFGPDAYRLVCGFGTTAAEVDALIEAVGMVAGDGTNGTDGRKPSNGVP